MSEVPRRGIWASAVHPLDSRSGASLLGNTQTFSSSVYYPSTEALAHPPADSQNVNAVIITLTFHILYPPFSFHQHPLFTQCQAFKRSAILAIVPRIKEVAEGNFGEA